MHKIRSNLLAFSDLANGAKGIMLSALILLDGIGTLSHGSSNLES